MQVILEIAISMVGLYIIFSIANSALVEGYTQLINKRGNHLKNSLDNFFQDPKNKDINLAKELYDHKLIRAFMEDNKILPSYIDPKIFTQAFMELVFKDTHVKNEPFTGELNEGMDKKLPGDLDKTLDFIIKKATSKEGVDMGKVQNEIDGLYDSYMGRVSEWYKKKMKFLLTVTGVILAFILNLDSINFFTALKNDSQLRSEQVQIARNLDASREAIIAKSEVLKDSLKIANFDPKSVEKGVNDLIGHILSEEDAKTLDGNFSELRIGLHQFTKGKSTTGDYAWGFFGILLTGFALSFGSTFWFGLLKKLVGK